MATVRARSGEVELTIKPYRLVEGEPPEWIQTQVQVKSGGEELLSTTVSMTSADLVDLSSGVRQMAKGKRERFVLASTDGDFSFELEPADVPGDIWVRIWLGEPYDVVKGYALQCRLDEIDRFVKGLGSDQKRMAAASQSAGPAGH